MKKITLLLVVSAGMLITSCNGLGGKDLKNENESLTMALEQRNAELDEMLSIFNDISEGFHQINAAEHRVDLQRGSVMEGSKTAREQVAEDIAFIHKQMAENKAKIAELQEKLKKSNLKLGQLERAVESMTGELVTKIHHIEELQAELSSKNIRIGELELALKLLLSENKELISSNEAKDKTVAAQDKALNAAWFVFGTKKELKEQKIVTDKFLQKKRVLQEEDFNKNYFTQIDIRTTKNIKLYTKSAEILTNHADGSYELAADSNGELTLKIKDPKKFWRVSKYLVIQVK